MEWIVQISIGALGLVAVFAIVHLARREHSQPVQPEIEAQQPNDEVGEPDATERLLLAMEAVADSRLGALTTIHVTLPAEDYKGRLIGRDGRNIRLFEHITGTDLIIDDTPETISISSLNSFNREVARIALINLIVDGRIHPARIEEIVDQAKSNLDAYLSARAESVLDQFGLEQRSEETVQKLAKSITVTRAGRSQFDLTVQTLDLVGHISEGLGIDSRLARQYALSYLIEGGESIPVQFERVTNLAKKIVEERPGSRKPELEGFLERLSMIEAIALSIPGVSRAFATKAGKELHVVVQSASSSHTIQDLHRLVSEKLQESLDLPQGFKIVVIQEMRAGLDAN